MTDVAYPAPALAGVDEALGRLLRYAFFAAVFLPYLRVLPIGSDVQPAALALAALVLVSSTTGRFPRTILPLFVVMCGSVLIAIVTGPNGVAVRGLANYFSLFIIAFAAYSALKAEGGMSPRFVSVMVWIWFAVGLLQVVVSRNFLTFLLSNARTTASRGVVGLAPEPTSYGIHCLILLLLVGDFPPGRQRRLLIGALLLQVIIFARSSMALLFLLIWGAMLLVTRAGPKRAIVGAVTLGAIGVGIVQAIVQLAKNLTGIRVLELIRLVATTPALILVRDQSISDRVAAIAFSFTGAVDAWLLPHGFGAWAGWVREIGPRMARYIPYYTAGDRIMSGYGAALYEIGFLGLLIPYVVTRAIATRYAHDRRQAITVGVVLNLLLITAVPLAYPPIGFLIGYYCFYANHHATSGARPPTPVDSATDDRARGDMLT